MTRPLRNTVLVEVRHPGGRALEPFLRRTAARHLRALGLGRCELSISLVRDAAIRKLNRVWRKKDKPTDVLSFPLDAAPLAGRGPRMLGDVVVSLDTARRQAQEAGETLEHELARYLAHGILHLLGHDHHAAGPRRKMAALETKLLGRPGMIG